MRAGGRSNDGARTLWIATSASFDAYFDESTKPLETAPRPPSAIGRSAYSREIVSPFGSVITFSRLLSQSQPSSSWRAIEPLPCDCHWSSFAFSAGGSGTFNSSKYGSTSSPFMQLNKLPTPEYTRPSPCFACCS